MTTTRKDEIDCDGGNSVSGGVEEASDSFVKE